VVKTLEMTKTSKTEKEVSPTISNVHLEEIQTKSGLIIPFRRAVVNEDNNMVIGDVSRRYKLVKNDDLLKSIQPVLDEMGFNGEPKAVSAKDGAICFFRFWGKDKRMIQEVTKGDIVQFGAEIFNSYNGSKRFGFHIIANRLVCTNGMVVPNTITSLSLRHVGKAANTNLLKDKFADFFEKVNGGVALWRKWISIRPTIDQVRTFLDKSPFGNRVRETIEGRFRGLKEDEQNVWGLYNLMTFHITHELRGRREDTKAYRRFNNTELVSNRLERMFR
jgi:hypothetical protein